MTVALLGAMMLAAIIASIVSPPWLIVIFPFYAIFVNSTKVGLPLDDACMVLTFFSALIYVFFDRGLYLTRAQGISFGVAVTLVVTLLVVALIHALVLRTSTFFSIAEAVAIGLRLIWPFLIAELLKNEKTIKRVALSTVMAWTVVILANAAIVAKTGQVDYLRSIGFSNVVGALVQNTIVGQTIFANANDFARFVCISLIPVAAGVAIWPPRYFKYGFELMFLTTFVAVTICAVSRMGMIVVAATGGLVYYFRGRLLQAAAGVVAIGLLSGFVVLVSPDLLTRVGHRFSTDSLENDPRTLLYAQGLKIIEENPLIGVGPGEFQAELIRTGWFTPATARNAHNNFIYVSAQYGVPAMILFLLYEVALTTYFWEHYRRGRSRRKIYASYGLLLMAVLFLFGMTASVISTDYFFYVIGLLMFGINKAREEEKADALIGESEKGFPLRPQAAAL